MSNIYDVAKLAGVSPATVSRVFNGISVNSEMEIRVHAAAAELSFTPNRTARRLRKRRSEVIALIIPDIENPFFTSLARGVEDRAQESGFSVVFCDSDEQHQKELTYLGVAHAEHMAGVILVPATDHPALDGLMRAKIPVVAVDRSTSNHPVDAVLLDNFEIGRIGTELMYSNGFRRVACITGPVETETAQLRAAGWRQVFKQHHPRANAETFLRHADYRVDGGREAMHSLLSAPYPPDAVVVANNSMTIGAMDALHELAMSPAEIGMACLGDLPYSVLQRSGVQVVPLPARALGTAAAEMLLNRIGGAEGPPERLIVRA